MESKSCSSNGAVAMYYHYYYYFSLDLRLLFIPAVEAQRDVRPSKHNGQLNSLILPMGAL